MGLGDLMRPRRPEPVNLRLSSLGSGIDPVEGRVIDGQVARTLRTEQGRRDIQIYRAVALGEVVQTAISIQRGVNFSARMAVMDDPEERATIDMLRETCAVGLNMLAQEMAR